MDKSNGKPVLVVMATLLDALRIYDFLILKKERIFFDCPLSFNPKKTPKWPDNFPLSSTHPSLHPVSVPNLY
jgi:hypothetical protein